MAPPFWKTIWYYLVGLTSHVSCAPATPLLGIYIAWKDSCHTHQDLCPGRMVTATQIGDMELPYCHLPWMRIQNHCITGGETEAWRGERGCPEHHVGSGVSGSGLVWQGKGEKKKERRRGEGRREEGRGKKKGRIKELSWSHTWQTGGQGQRGPQ